MDTAQDYEPLAALNQAPSVKRASVGRSAVRRGGRATKAAFGVDQSQPQAIASARQIACIFAGAIIPTKRNSSLCLTVKMLQRLTQDVAFSPSSTPNATSVGAPRRVDVIAATVTV
jgi:hypothetical protein